MIASGLPLAARPASVTESASARAKLAVCSKMIWYLSFSGSRTLCTPLLRSIAGPAPGWPCRWKSLAPFGNAATMACASASPPLMLSAPTWARMPSTPSTRRSMVTTGMPALHRLLDGRRQRVDVERRDDDGVDLLHDRRLDVGGLLGRRVLAVALDQVDALRLGLGLDLVQHVDEEREARGWAPSPGWSACPRRKPPARQRASVPTATDDSRNSRLFIDLSST